ncbi:MAG: MBL fold metallo-hydrolase [Eubacteriales bacterium]|nr:MBL fold metallo-hydrolase [Eubacteriales bacterium]
MKMYVIGTGVATVSKYINTASIFEENGQLFLVDGTGGNDVVRSFDRFNLNWCDLHHAFLSHEHTDHFLGMVWVIRMIAEKIELKEYDGDFYLYGHAEVLGKMDTVCRMILKKSSQGFLGKRIHLVPVEDHQQMTIWNHQFTFFDIGSTKAKQYGFCMIYGDGKRLVFAGDEPLKENGQRYCKDADWLLSEAFCLYDEEQIHHAYHYNHQTVKEAGIIAQEQNVKNLLIWHTEDKTIGRRRELYTQEAKQFFDGNVFVPDDGDVLEI